MRLIDTHTHLNFAQFKTDATAVAEQALAQNIGLVVVGVEAKTSQRAIELAEQFLDKPVYAAVGLHPFQLTEQLIDETDQEAQLKFKTSGAQLDLAALRQLAQSSPKVVAIGEIGLDYMHLPKNKAARQAGKLKQQQVFIAQLKLAQQLNLPVIMHSRLAYKGVLEVFAQHPELAGIKLVAHGFVGTLEQLKTYLELGFYIGLNGIIFKNIKGIDFVQIIKAVPLERILLETDCPYLAPPELGLARNTPSAGLPAVLAKVSQLTGLAEPELAALSTANAKIFFGLPA